MQADFHHDIGETEFGCHSQDMPVGGQIEKLGGENP